MEKIEPVVAISDPGEVDRASHSKGDRFIIAISNVFAWLFPILVIAICAQVVLRSSGVNQAWLDDLQWWLYGSAVLVGIAYAVTTDSHVRVDIFYDNFSKAKQQKINIFGLAWLFLPFVILSWDITIHYAVSSVAAWEGSDSPNGLHNLWILKVLMNLTFIIIGLATWFAYVRNLSNLCEPLWWRKLLYAFPSVMFLVNLSVYYAAWWIVWLSSPPDMNARRVTRHWFFDEIEVGVEEIKITIIVSLVLTIAIIGVARLMARPTKTAEE